MKRGHIMELIALDLGGTLTKCARMNENGEILQARKVPSATDHPKNLLASLDECVLPWLDGADGIAVSMPGKIDPARGIALTGGAFAWIENLPIGKLLSERYHLPVSVDNDGKCAAAAESWLGALQDVPMDWFMSLAQALAAASYLITVSCGAVT